MHRFAQSLAMLLRRIAAVILFCPIALTGGIALAAEPDLAVTVGRSGQVFVVDATMAVGVSLGTAWAVLTDFDHMASILGNLSSSKVTSRNGNTWIVRQEGVARYGLLSFAFESEREIRLDPMKRILARNLSGTLKGMQSEATIIPSNQGVTITYHASILPDSLLARIFGASFLRHQVEEQFLAMAREMARRHGSVDPLGNAS